MAHLDRSHKEGEAEILGQPVVINIEVNMFPDGGRTVALSKQSLVYSFISKRMIKDRERISGHLPSSGSMPVSR